MLFSKATIVAIMAAVASAADINFVYSRGDFSTISNGVGNENGHSSGFTITDADGNELYNEAYPDDVTPCSAYDGTTFKFSSSCWDGEYSFHCTGDQYGNIKSCEAGPDGGDQVEGSTDSDTNFIGIAIAMDHSCGAGLTVPKDCGPGATFNIESHIP